MDDTWQPPDDETLLRASPEETQRGFSAHQHAEVASLKRLHIKLFKTRDKDKTLKVVRVKTQRTTAAFLLGAEQARGQEGHVSEACKDENRLEESD